MRAGAAGRTKNAGTGPWVRRRLAVALAVALAAAPLAVLAAILAAGPAAAKPGRIVSLNLCTDQLVMLLAERGRIASVSYLAADPESSAMAATAKGLRLNHGRAEEILPLKPDLILAGSFTTRATVFLLRKLGLRVLEIPVARSLDDIRTNIRTVAEALGERARGATLIADFDARLRAAAAPGPGTGPGPKTGTGTGTGPRPLAALYWANGYSSGRDTLANAMLEAAGFENLAVRLGLTGTARLPLEALVAARPEVLIAGGRRGGTPSLADAPLRHPALVQAFAGRPMIRISDRLWVCGTPFVADAVGRLAAFRKQALRGAPSGSGRP